MTSITDMWLIFDDGLSTTIYGVYRNGNETAKSFNEV